MTAADKITDVVVLMEQAQRRLNTHDLAFNEAVELVLGIMRSKGLVPHKRISVNGAWHRLLAAALVEAYEQNTQFVLPTRCQGELHNRGASTTVVSFLDASVKEGLICSLSPDGKAKGALSLGDIVTAYLDSLTDTGIQN